MTGFYDKVDKFGPAVHAVLDFYRRGGLAEDLERNFYPIIWRDSEYFPNIPFFFEEAERKLILACWRKIHSVCSEALSVRYEFHGAKGRKPDLLLEYHDEVAVVDIKTGTEDYVPSAEHMIKAYQQTAETARTLDGQIDGKPAFGRILFFMNAPGKPLRFEWREPQLPEGITPDMVRRFHMDRLLKILGENSPPRMTSMQRAARHRR